MTVISEAFVHSQKQVKNKQRTSLGSQKPFLTMTDSFINSLCFLQIKSEASQTFPSAAILPPRREGTDSSANMHAVESLPAALTWQK